MKEHVQIAAMILAAYLGYIGCHLAANQAIPNGALLSGVIGALCLLAGVKWGGLSKEQELIKQRGTTTPIDD